MYHAYKCFSQPDCSFNQLIITQMIHGWGSWWQGCDIRHATTFLLVCLLNVIAASCTYSHWTIPVLVTCHVSLQFSIPLTAPATAPVDYHSRWLFRYQQCVLSLQMFLTNWSKRKQYVDLSGKSNDVVNDLALCGVNGETCLISCKSRPFFLRGLN